MYQQVSCICLCWLERFAKLVSCLLKSARNSFLLLLILLVLESLNYLDILWKMTPFLRVCFKVRWIFIFEWPIFATHWEAHLCWDIHFYEELWQHRILSLWNRRIERRNDKSNYIAIRGAAILFNGISIQWSKTSS
mgnify:CR=1 FL=1